MEHVNENRQEDSNVEGVSKNRRLLLKAGWTIPVIAATPLLNTASAVSTADCSGIFAQMENAKKQGDKSLYQSLKIVAKDAGCDTSGY